MTTQSYFEIGENNLRELSKRANIVDEQRNIVIRELVASILNRTESDTLELAYREFLANLSSVTVADKHTFSEACAELMPRERILSALPFGDSEQFTTAGAHGKIAYVRNRYNDEAFSRFSATIPHAKHLYLSDFESCCEAVSADECEFTILPLENTTDGKMFGFYSLLDRFELKIDSVSTLESEDSSRSIRYALVGKRFRSAILDSAEQKRIFELSITYSPRPQLLELYLAASRWKLKEHRSSSLSLPYNDNMVRFYHSFIIDERSELLPFLIFLTLEYPQYSPIGVYREI